MPKSAIAIVLVILILYCYLTAGVKSAEKFVEGYWVGDDDFCEQSEVDSILLYIGEASGWVWKKRTAYIVITDGVTSQAITLTHRRGWSSGPGEYKIVASAEFEDEQLWPEYVEITSDMTNGKMKIVDPETGEIYLMATKNNEITNITR